ncbi:YdcF family protein [Niveispirillum sp. SYP-B3756]|uniref:YdcF family protein n=1 Tax=Niveispirillum sp. SYP-B3756 TaxID=2662178 RepID=UPI001B3B4A9D|nr:YdcF family protein [Niveispirillum sp. SYP-B3756]
MGFELGKLLAALTAPGNIIGLLALAGLLLMVAGRALGRWFLALTALLLTLIMVTPVSTWALLPLEQRFPAPVTLPAGIDAIIVLGGSVSPIGSMEHGAPQLNQEAERLTVVPGLMRHYPDIPVIFSGGSGDPREPDAREAPVAAALLTDLGVDMGRLRLESTSRNTWENAVNSKPLLPPGGRVLLVTSAAHMPRSVGIFRKVGIDVVPYPVSYGANRLEQWRFGLNLADNLSLLERAAYEYRGLIVYWLSGRTSALFPAP